MKKFFRRARQALERRRVIALSVALAAAISAGGLMLDEHSTTMMPPAPTVIQSGPSETQLPAADTGYELPDIDHPRVDSWITRFTTSMRSSYATYLSRMTRYEGMISKKLAERRMPQDLIYLAMIESGFDARAKSPARASGLWQFMTGTAKQYGLTVTKRVDERNDPVQATDAALTYLSKLHERFGSWYLAAAAYNAGPGTVSRVLERVTGRSRGTDADYYRIANRLPAETRDYVPKMIAAARIGNDPAKYGFGAS